MLYAADGPGGEPGTRLLYSSATMGGASNGVPEIIAATWADPQSIAAGTYWIGACLESGTTELFTESASGGTLREYDFGDWLFGPPIVWPDDADTHRAWRELRIRVDYP